MNKIIIKGRQILIYSKNVGETRIERMDYDEFCGLVAPGIDTYKYGSLPANCLGVKFKNQILYYMFYNYETKPKKIYVRMDIRKEDETIVENCYYKVKTFPRIWISAVKREPFPPSYWLFTVREGVLYVYPSFNVASSGKVCLGDINVAPDKIEEMFWEKTIFSKQFCAYKYAAIENFYINGVVPELISPLLNKKSITTIEELWGVI